MTKMYPIDEVDKHRLVWDVGRVEEQWNTFWVLVEKQEVKKISWNN
jgi:hypothetical protein